MKPRNVCLPTVSSVVLLVACSNHATTGPGFEAANGGAAANGSGGQSAAVDSSAAGTSARSGTLTGGAAFGGASSSGNPGGVGATIGGTATVSTAGQSATLTSFTGGSGGLTTGGTTAGGASATVRSGTGGTAAAATGGASEARGSGGTPNGGTASSTGGAPIVLSFSNEDEEILFRAVRFYGAERCGDNHNWTLTENPAGQSCHLRDGESVGLDLSGGWHDAGDHVKVTMTIAYAAYILLKAYEVYPSAFEDYDDTAYTGVPNGVPDVLDEARIGLDWLVKAHPDANRLVAMVANADYDHSTFMTSPKASTNTVELGGEPRPVQMTAKADFAGATAAALSLASRLYTPFDAAQAGVYLTKAKSAYAYAKANPSLSTSMLYAWTGMTYTDDLMCGATELWRATSDTTYRSDATSRNSSIGATKSIAGYGQISDFCRHSLVKGGEQAALTPWTADVDRYLTLISSDSNLKGLIYSDKWGTCRHAMSVAFSAALLYDVTKDTKYRDFARSQYAWIKGNNPQTRSFIIGWGTNPPTRPHHRNAYGYEDDLGWDADTPQLSDTRPFRYLLSGALVGGPNLEGYQDSVNDYVHNEVAIDYNAGLVGTAAFSVVNR